MSAATYARIQNDIAVLKKTGETTDFLARKAAKYEWVMKEAYPMLYPPSVLDDFTFDVNYYLTSSSAWWAAK